MSGINLNFLKFFTIAFPEYKFMIFILFPAMLAWINYSNKFEHHLRIPVECALESTN